MGQDVIQLPKEPTRFLKKPLRIPIYECPKCQYECRGTRGLRHHINRVHPTVIVIEEVT